MSVLKLMFSFSVQLVQLIYLMASSLVQSKYFSEKDIEDFRQCFKLYAKEGYVGAVDKLGFIMRSLGMAPTINELKGYYNSHKKEGILHKIYNQFLN